MRILLATDGSLEADLAEAALLRLPLRDPEILVSMVVSGPNLAFTPFGAPDESGMLTTNWQQQVIADKTVERICDRLTSAGFNAKSHVTQGDVANELIDTARDQNMELVAVGSSIDSNVQAFFLGSVSRKLTLYSDSSILVARHFRSEPTDGSVDRIRTKKKLDVLLAYDGSSELDPAVESLASMGRAEFRKLFVLTVAPTGARSKRKPKVEKSMGDAEITALASAQRIAKRLAHCAEFVEAISMSGRPSEAIVDTAAKHDVDFVIMAASRHGAFERLMVGSCAYETVSKAPCSVLILRGSLALR